MCICIYIYIHIYIYIRFHTFSEARSPSGRVPASTSATGVVRAGPTARSANRPMKATILRGKYAERRIKYGILFICSQLCGA